MSIRILIADPHPLAGATLGAWLERTADLHVVGTFDCGTDAIRRARATAPDVVVVGVPFDEPSGLDMVRALTRKPSASPVLILSRMNQTWMAEAMLEAGASGYLLRSDAPSFMLEVVQGIAAGEEGWLSPQLSKKLVPGGLSVGDQLGKLTPREREVLAEVMQGSTNPEIADALHVSVGTVKNHVHHILQKLEMPSRLRLIVWGHTHEVAAWLRAVES